MDMDQVYNFKTIKDYQSLKKHKSGSFIFKIELELKYIPLEKFNYKPLM